jgi:DNA-binding YbaB/EbfC family protein
VEPGGQLDMQQLLAAAAAMQSQLMSAQQELADAEVAGTAGGGLVTAIVNGQGELVDLSIAASAIDAGDPEETAQTLADLVLAAYRDACRAVDDLQQETMAPFAAGFGGGMPGMPDLSGFPGLPGMPGAQGLPGQSEPEDPPAAPPAQGTAPDEN